MISVNCDGRSYPLDRDCFTRAKLLINMRELQLFAPVAFEINGMSYTGLAIVIDRLTPLLRVRVRDPGTISGESEWTFGGEDLDLVRDPIPEYMAAIAAPRFATRAEVARQKDLDEEERCKAHGASLYADAAATCEQVRILARAAWVASLPLIDDHENAADYAARCNMLPPKPGQREQWEDSVVNVACERLELEVTS